MNRRLIFAGLALAPLALATGLWLGGRNEERPRSAIHVGLSTTSTKSGERAPQGAPARSQNPFIGRGEADPAAAFHAWAEDRKDRAEPTELIRNVRRQLGFEAAIRLIQQLSEPDLRERCLKILASQVGELPRPEAGMECLLALDSAASREVLPIAVGSWARGMEFDRVTDWLHERQAGFSAAELAHLERTVAGPWVESQPEAAAGWLLGRADEESFPEHLAHVAGIWAELTPNAAGEWLGSLPPGPQNDLAFATFSRVVTPADPRSAAMWAAAIRNPDLRSRSLASALAQWSKLDPHAASAFAATQVR